MHRSKLILLILIISPFISSAQHKEAGHLDYWYVPVKYKDTGANVRMVDLNVGLPIYRKPAASLLANVELKTVQFSNFPLQNIPTLYSVSFQAAYVRKINQNLSLALFGQLGVFSDFKDLSAEDVRGTIGFQYRIKHSETFKSGLGIAYSNQFFGNELLPYINIDYNPGPDWRIYGQVPSNVKAEYKLSKKDFIGFGVRGLTNSYRLSKTEYNSSFVQTVEWHGKLFWERFIYRNWSVNLNAGYTFSQTFRLYDDIDGAMLNSWTILTIPVGKKRPEPKQEIKRNGMIYQVGVAYNIF